jgi:hypothetical protein
MSIDAGKCSGSLVSALSRFTDACLAYVLEAASPWMAACSPKTYERKPCRIMTSASVGLVMGKKACAQMAS